MEHAVNAVIVDRPIEDVFAYIADGRNNTQWRAGVLEIERTSVVDGENATYRQVLKGPGGRRIAGDYRVTAYSPPDLLEFAVIAGPARPTGRFELASVDPRRTRVTFSLDLQPTGVMRLVKRMITKRMQVEVGPLDRLKEVLERTQPMRGGPARSP